LRLVTYNLRSVTCSAAESFWSAAGRLRADSMMRVLTLYRVVQEALTNILKHVQLRVVLVGGVYVICEAALSVAGTLGAGSTICSSKRGKVIRKVLPRPSSLTTSTAPP